MASGDIGPPVVVVKDKFAEKDSMKILEVPGACCLGYIVVMPHRTGTPEFCEWLLEKVIVPFFEKQQQMVRRLTGSDAEAQGLLVLDGESGQLMATTSSRSARLAALVKTCAMQEPSTKI